MKYRRLVVFPCWSTACVLLLLGVLSHCGRGIPRQPSVILISLDTLRADHMGVYGYERPTTPNLDRLASESIVFEHAFAPAVWTLISHMSMLTGAYPNQHGVLDLDMVLSPET